jgi:hypothetical protein
MKEAFLCFNQAIGLKGRHRAQRCGNEASGGLLIPDSAKETGWWTAAT